MGGLDPGSLAALFGTLIVLAAIPGVSVLTVSVRSAASGFVHGVFTSMGIVAGDIVFILLAILGLSVLAEAMGGLFVLVKYLGGACLLWLGIMLWKARTGAIGAEAVTESSLLSSFSAGLFITLADQKAILFYLGLFPAFVDLSRISLLDTGIIVAIAAVAVGGVKIVYAYMADRAGSLVIAKAHRAMNMLAGSVMIAVGAFLIAKA